MQVTTEMLENRTVALQVEVESERVNRAFERVYRQLGRYVEVPGFRPGKAPIGLLRQALREDYVRQQVLEQLLKETMNDALKQAQVEPYGAPPELDVQQLEEGKPMLYSLKVPLEPAVELGDYRALKVTRFKPAVTDEDVERQIESLRRQHARYQRVEREARPGDVVFVSIVPYFEGESEPGETRWDMVPVEEGEPHPLRELVLGAGVGETREGTVQFPENYADPLLQGKRARVQVTIRGVSELVLPDDEELLRLRQAESMDALRQQVRNELEQELTEYAERLTRSSMRRAVLQAAKVEISPVIIQSQARDSLAALSEQLRRGGYTLADYARGYQMSEEQFVDYWYGRTASDILYSLIIRAIQEREGIQLTEEERQQAIRKVAEEQGMTEEEAAQSEALQTELDSLVYEKTLQFLWSVADVTEEELSIQTTSEQSDNEE